MMNMGWLAKEPRDAVTFVLDDPFAYRATNVDMTLTGAMFTA